MELEAHKRADSMKFHAIKRMFVKTKQEGSVTPAVPRSWPQYVDGVMEELRQKPAR